jgi:hypothetical protein
MILIQIETDGVIHSTTREKIDPVHSLDDLMNLLFVAGYDLDEIQKAILETAEQIKNNHKNESKTIPNTCSI